MDFITGVRRSDWRLSVVSDESLERIFELESGCIDGPISRLWLLLCLAMWCEDLTLLAGSTKV